MGTETNNFIQALQQYSQKSVALTSENLTDMDKMIFTQLAGDRDIQSIVSGNAGYTSDIRSGNAQGMKLGDALNSRLDHLNQQIIKCDKQLNNTNLSSNQRAELLAKCESYQKDKAFFQALNDSERFSELWIGECVDYAAQGVSDTTGETYQSYMRASTVQLSDGTYVCSFAGTGAEAMSWLEDGRIVTTEAGVDAQKATLEYVNYVMGAHSEEPFVMNGYSKGGNLGLYSAIMCNEQERIVQVSNIDGPGFSTGLLSDPEFLERYQQLSDRLGEGLYCLSPKDSVVGHLMDDHENYQYVDTDGVVVANHDYVYWKWNSDGSATRVEKRSEVSLIIESMFENLITSFSDEELDKVFDLLEEYCNKTGIVYLGDLGKVVQNEAGEFDLTLLVQSLLQAGTTMTLEEQILLHRVLGETLTAEHGCQLIEAILDDWSAKTTGTDEGTFAKKVIKYLDSTPGDELLVVTLVGAVQSLLNGIIVAANIAATLQAATEKLMVYLADIKEKVVNGVNYIKDMTISGMNFIRDKVDEVLDRAAELAGQYLTEVLQRFKESRTYENMKILWSDVGLMEKLRTVLTINTDFILDAADHMMKGSKDIAVGLVSFLQFTQNNLRAGVESLNKILNELCSVCVDLVKKGINLASVQIKKTWSYINSWNISVDISGIDKTIQKLQQAEQRSDGLEKRLYRLMWRELTDDDGVVRSFQDMYQLITADIVVDFHDDIDKMTGNVRTIKNAYGDMTENLTVKLRTLKA